MKLFGRDTTRREVAALSGSAAQFFGVRSVVGAAGAERGVGLLEFRSGGGLRFTVLVDRAMDIADCDHNGRAIGWQSPTGFVHPGLLDPAGEGGLGFLRGFSGLLNTCGLDHFGFMHTGDAARYDYPARKTVDWPLHGRVNALPARLSSYGEEWDGDECTLFAEGVVTQAAVFGEHLTLTRRIEVRAGENRVTLHDRVENRGFSRTPHMLLYHLDLGYPVVAEGSRYVAPMTEAVWASHEARYRDQGVGYRTVPKPRAKFTEQVWQHGMAADGDGVVPVAVVNDALAFGVLLETRAAELPCHLQWQHFQSGAYAMGIEPGTNYARGHGFAEERGELIELGHAEARDYHLSLSVLDGTEAIAGGAAGVVVWRRRVSSGGPCATAR